ncbi:GTA-gp10 family protein [Paracoccus alkanivorans]|uniref:Gene transfer agent family protein n=1 Tax=Paracoccus alkanivorans TaxID=2116655 RepID=A0A3M0MJ78_9RHOB|nr:GTA-gp10 family protein [Paracoccus alkanivorans]RMC37495.1 hypothetical protein C9E81_01720 [Paracoccus alkanivorans]
MANAYRGEVALEYEGETYTMVLDFNAMCEFEDLTGTRWQDMEAVMENGEARMNDLRALMLACLRDRHPDMDARMAGRIFSQNIDAFQRAVTAANPEADAGNANRPARRTGRK